MGSSVTVLLQNALLIQIDSKFENPSIFNDVKAFEVKGNKKVCQFFGSPCWMILCRLFVLCF